LSSKGSPTIIPKEVIRADHQEKEDQIKTLQNLHQRNEAVASNYLTELQQTAIQNQNIFEHLMEVCKYCSLGQITHALYEVGGQYRRSM